MTLYGKWETAMHLCRTYMTALPRMAYRSSLSLLLDPKGAQRFLHQVLSAQDLEEDCPVLGSVAVADLLPGQADIQICGSYQEQCSSSTRILMELVSLAYMIQLLQPRVIFEIGTFLGRTTRLLALNSPPECRIFTLDLPPDQVTHDVGAAFRDSREARKITQLHGDSRTLDYSPYYGQCDFIWVDACHGYPFVVQDTQAALRLRHERGWIAWHDYRHTAWWSGVTRAVRELAKTQPGIRHIRGTTMALLPPEEPMVPQGPS